MLGMPNLPSDEIEAKELALEERKFEADSSARNRELELRAKELDATLEEAKRSQLTNPLALAVVGAFIAGLASIGAQYLTGKNQIQADNAKHKMEMETEAFKAESARILEAIRSGDSDKAACNLRFFLDAGLITTEKLRDFLKTYIANRKGGSGVSTGGSVAGVQVTTNGDPNAGTSEICSPAPEHAVAPTPTPVPTATPTPVLTPTPTPSTQIMPPHIETFSTGWMGGGHNQNEGCDRGIATFQARFPNQKLTRLDSSEESRKDFLGHVEYNYYCRIQVGG